jgi:ribosomal protein S18 acetylase RimI-like enzyme
MPQDTHEYVIRPLSAGDIPETDLDRLFGRFYWCRGPEGARSHLQGAELWGAWRQGWIGIIGLALEPDGSLAITPWTPTASAGETGMQAVLLDLLEKAKEIAMSRRVKLVSRMRDIHGDHAEASVNLLKAAGFRRVGLRYVMACDLEDPQVQEVISEAAGPDTGAVWMPVNDPEAILDLAFACFHTSEDSVESDWTREEWAAWFRTTGQGGRGTFLPAVSEICILEGRPAGFYLATESNGALYLSDLGVLPEQRGLGLGRALVQRFLSKGMRLGYKTSTVRVAAENTPAVRLYERYGYRRKASVAMGEVWPCANRAS